jgi:Txe/YoeB family toxin of Txe-Axe toxin-antitoxin module
MHYSEKAKLNVSIETAIRMIAREKWNIKESFNKQIQDMILIWSKDIQIINLTHC